MERREVYYTGRVQGVGFRATARQLAQHQGVSGYVRNLPDGRVHLVAQGTPSQLDEYLSAVDRAMGVRIQRRQIDSRPTSDEFDEFQIRY